MELRVLLAVAQAKSIALLAKQGRKPDSQSFTEDWPTKRLPNYMVQLSMKPFLSVIEKSSEI